MTGNTSTTHTPDTVFVGQVTFWNAEKGFGFAEITYDDPLRWTTVFFREEKCRRVTGTADEPVLTNETADSSAESYPRTRGRSPSRLVMRVVQDKKGLRATAWGIVPKRDWIADLNNSGQFNYYLGGKVSSWFFRGQEGYIDGTLEDIELTPTQLTVHIRNPRGKNQDGLYEPARPGLEVVTYRLDSIGGKSLNAGAHSFTFWVDGREATVMIRLP